MPSLLNRTCLSLVLAAAACGPLLALDAAKWSLVRNETDSIYNVTITDVASLGSLRIRPKGDTSNGVEMGRRVLAGKDTMAATALAAHTDYEFYFETNMLSQHALKFQIQSSTDARDKIEFRFSNLGASTALGSETIEINAPSLSKAHVHVDPSGYRNSAGGTLITIK